MNKLPKQWNHWLADSHFRDTAPTKKYKGLFFKGKNRIWRVVNETLQVGEPYAYFDRWANSYVGSVPIPQTKNEFRAAIVTLLSMTWEQI